MHLYDWPLFFVLAGLALYVVLGGADFGAGFWQLTAGSGERAARIRDLAHESIAPVWEANHVWLIFVLTVTWTAYPRAFGSIASTLCVALFVAAIGIIMRGALYALRSGTSAAHEQRAVDTFFGISCVLTPFALGAAAGGIASGRVPVGNAAGNLFTSWLNPTSIAIGLIAVATGAYLAAVYLSADARRAGDRELEDAFRRRALAAGVAAGAAALGGIVVVHADAHALYRGLVEGNGLPAVIVSALAGGATLVLVWLRRFELARIVAALAVAAIIAGWALAQSPYLLPGLTVQRAAASNATLAAVVIAVLVGALVLFPSLATLFRLVLRGHLDHAEPEQEPVAPEQPGRPLSPRRGRAFGRGAVALLVIGFVLVNVASSELAHGIGALFFVAFAAAAFRALMPLGGAESPS